MTIREIIIVPHTHWDREWYEPESVFRIALIDAVDRVIELIERDELPVFLLDGQTAIVEDYLRVHPERTECVRRLADEGKLLMGPWYVLADELLTGDEALVRNLLIGRAIAERFGRWLPVGYSPDAFGHPAALPSILRGFGIQTAIVWRGYGGEAGQRGDLFDWEAPDGARVRTHHLPPEGYEVGAELPTNEADLAARWVDLKTTFESRAQTGVVLLLNGADHHAPQSGLKDAARALGARSGVRVTVGSPETYFAAVKDARVPTVRGELRFSYRYTWTLQGVHATRSHLKRVIAEGEQLLTRWVEPQMALGGAGSIGVLDQLWRDHLASCAHDSIGGCCADDVARDVGQRARGVALAARRAWLNAALHRAGYDPVVARRQSAAWRPSLIVVNPTPWERGGVVEATLTFKIADVNVGRPRVPDPHSTLSDVGPAPLPIVRDPDGTQLPLQVLESSVGYERIDSPRNYPDQDVVHQVRVAVWVPSVPALGLRCFYVEDDGSPSRSEEVELVKADGNGIRSAPMRRARPPAMSRTGPPSSAKRMRPSPAVRERGTGGEGERASESEGEPHWDVHESHSGFRFVSRTDPRIWTDVADIVSEPDAGDTYTFQPHGSPIRARWAPLRIVHSGPLVAVVAREFEIPERARGTVYVRLAADADLIWVTVEGENLSAGHRLRTHFPAAGGDAVGRTFPSVADMHYGAVARRREEYDLHAFPWEWPVSTAPMHRFVSTGGTDGMTVFARGAFEYEHDREGGVYVTILRSVDQLSRSDLGARPGHVGWPTPTPDAGELGPFRLELGWWGRGITLQAKPDDWDALHRRSEMFHAPLAGIGLRSALEIQSTVAGPKLIGKGLAVRAVKPARSSDAVVLRCVNLTERLVRGAWIWPGRIHSATQARLDETPIGNPIPVAKQRIPFTAAAREIVTILVTGDLG